MRRYGAMRGFRKIKIKRVLHCRKLEKLCSTSCPLGDASVSSVEHKARLGVARCGRQGPSVQQRKPDGASDVYCKYLSHQGRGGGKASPDWPSRTTARAKLQTLRAEETPPPPPHPHHPGPVCFHPKPAHVPPLPPTLKAPS